MYDKPLFQDKTAASIYNIKEYDDNIDEDNPDAEKTQAQKAITKLPTKGFEGAEKKAARTKPVEFEKAVIIMLKIFINRWKMSCLVWIASEIT